MGGHLRRRGSSWELVAYAGRDPLNGKRKYVSRTFKGPKREAQTALDRLVVEVEDGHEGGSGSTVGELLDSWVEVFSPKWSPSTLRQTTSVVEHHLRPRWGSVPLRRVTPVDIDRFDAVRTGPAVAAAEDLTDLPFVTIDPPGSRDLDQALHITAGSGGWVLRYAIADLAVFVRAGGANSWRTQSRCDR